MKAEKVVVKGVDEKEVTKRQVRRENQKIRTAWSKEDRNKFVYREVIEGDPDWGYLEDGYFYNWVKEEPQKIPDQGFGSIAHIGIPVVTVVLRIDWLNEKEYRVIGRGISIKTPEDKMDKEGRRRGINKAIGRINKAVSGYGDDKYTTIIKDEDKDYWKVLVEDYIDSEDFVMGVYSKDGIELSIDEVGMLDNLYKNSKRV